jgi:hypothetical protein
VYPLVVLRLRRKWFKREKSRNGARRSDQLYFFIESSPACKGKFLPEDMK